MHALLSLILLLGAPAREGATGLDTVLSADTGEVGTFRLRLSLLYFEADDFPREDTTDTFSGGTLALAYTPLQPLELYLAAKATSNINRGTQPELLQTQGDLTLGAKGGWFFTPVIGAALSLSAHFVSGLGEGGFNAEGTSVWIRALGTADFHRGEMFPLRVLVDLGYYVENSDSAAGDEAEPIDLIQEFGLQLATYDRVTLGFALESPFSEYVSAWLEYRIDTPLEVDLTQRERLEDEFVFASLPHALTPGVRVTPVPALAIDAAVRIGLSDEPYRGVPATPPWMLVFGLAYTLDPTPEPVVVEAPPASQPVVAAPAEGGIAGRVLDAKSGAAVADARIEYVGRPLTAQVADGAGRFVSYRLPPGPVKVRASGAGHAAREVEAVVEAGRDAALEIRLEAAAPRTGSLTVQVVDATGKAVAAEVTVSGDPPLTGRSRADGPLQLEVPPGKVEVTANAAGFAPKTLEVEVKVGEPATLRLSLVKGSGKAGGSVQGTARIAGRKIQLSKKIKFADSSARLLGSANALLDDVAALLAANPQITRVRIEGHTDDRGEPEANRRLSEQRARAVESALVARGVARSRLTAKGYGADKPAAPNLTPAGREKNRRVELVISEQGKAE